MCGIIGAVAQRNVEAILVAGLKRLEYRGYDSAGLALINKENTIERARVQGKVELLADELKQHPIHGHTGIAHTRWATHGVPSEANAHPHMSGTDFAIVHNGIIENYVELREQLIQQGYIFTSQTDSEVIAHLLASEFKKNNNLLHAVQQTVKQLHGAFALAILYRPDADRIIAVRRGSPLVIGIGIEENFVASDQLALLPVTQNFIYLEEGDLADIHHNSLSIYAQNGNLVERKIQHSDLLQQNAERGEYRHFMLKEIFEQPTAINNMLEGRILNGHIPDEIFGVHASKLFDQVKQIQIVACGTSYHAGLVARYWLESLARIPCNVEVASEIRYRHPVVQAGTLFITLSQSGETADTLAALRDAKQNAYLGSLSICNVPHSSLVRESDLVLLTRAGPEIGVASTKAFTTQLVALLLLTIVLGRRHGLKDSAALIDELQQLPRLIEKTLTLDKPIAKLAEQFVAKHHTLFLGRGIQYPIALEGALKLKEISYIHAEAYPAGELKHGPLALVDEDMPVVTIAPNDALLEKLKSNLQEVRARGGKLFVFADKQSHIEAADDIQTILMPSVSAAIAPIIYTIPLQLLAYHVAFLKGTDIDKPRNLAKSVTVE